MAFGHEQLGCIVIGSNDSFTFIMYEPSYTVCNPPGAVLAALSGAALVTALAHHWRAPRRFLAFAAVCLGAVVALGAVGIGIDISVTSHYVGGPAASVLESAGSALVLAIAFVGVPAVLVGLVGGLATWLLGRRK